jgi:hypothetical protein
LSGATILDSIGVTFIALGFACSLLSLFHIAPKGSRFAALSLGLMGRRQDFTGTGWRFVQCGQLLALVGFALFFVSRWMTTA